MKDVFWRDEKFVLVGADGDQNEWVYLFLK